MSHENRKEDVHTSSELKEIIKKKNALEGNISQPGIQIPCSGVGSSKINTKLYQI